MVWKYSSFLSLQWVVGKIHADDIKEIYTDSGGPQPYIFSLIFEGPGDRFQIEVRKPLSLKQRQSQTLSFHYFPPLSCAV